MTTQNTSPTYTPFKTIPNEILSGCCIKELTRPRAISFLERAKVDKVRHESIIDSDRTAIALCMAEEILMYGSGSGSNSNSNPNSSSSSTSVGHYSTRNTLSQPEVDFVSSIVTYLQTAVPRTKDTLKKVTSCIGLASDITAVPDYRVSDSLFGGFKKIVWSIQSKWRRDEWDRYRIRTALFVLGHGGMPPNTRQLRPW